MLTARAASAYGCGWLHRKEPVGEGSCGCLGVCTLVYSLNVMVITPRFYLRPQELSVAK